jgi:hypothetical protein
MGLALLRYVPLSFALDLFGRVSQKKASKKASFFFQQKRPFAPKKNVCIHHTTPNHYFSFRSIADSAVWPVD